jgi:hypothetical protein
MVELRKLMKNVTVFSLHNDACISDSPASNMVELFITTNVRTSNSTVK